MQNYNTKLTFKNQELYLRVLLGEYRNEKQGIVFQLWKPNNFLIGEIFCRDDKLRERVWYLDTIWVELELRGEGYGSLLLEKTCEILAKIDNLDILLERPSKDSKLDGFNLKKWYEKHAFEPHPNPDITFMWRKSNK